MSAPTQDEGSSDANVIEVKDASDPYAWYQEFVTAEGWTRKIIEDPLRFKHSIPVRRKMGKPIPTEESEVINCKRKGNESGREYDYWVRVDPGPLDFNQAERLRYRAIQLKDPGAVTSAPRDGWLERESCDRPIFWKMQSGAEREDEDLDDDEEIEELRAQLQEILPKTLYFVDDDTDWAQRAQTPASGEYNLPSQAVTTSSARSRADVPEK